MDTTLQSLNSLSSSSSSFSRASSHVASSSSAVCCSFRHSLRAHAKLKTPRLSLPTLPINNNIQELMTMGGSKSQQLPILPFLPNPNQNQSRQSGNEQEEEEEEEEEEEKQSLLVAKLYAIAEIAADRAEMHGNVADQRNNWNTLFLNSINAITLTASTMAALTLSLPHNNASLSLRLSSTLLYSAATALFLVVNKIQPSQLAEEQRNAVRLFGNLHTQIQTHLALDKTSKPDHVNKAMASVLALDKAYPLPLLPGMLDKFPAKVEPAVWWPAFDSRPHRRQHSHHQKKEQFEKKKKKKNGWSIELEERLAGIIRVLKEKDTAEYLRLSNLVLTVNRILATAGPLLTGAAALGAASSSSSALGGSVGVVAGVLACLVNVLEHGGQVGMVFEMYRNCAGFYRLLEETIESSLSEEEGYEGRENGELLEMKIGLQLGRSLSSLSRLASSSSSSSNKNGNANEFAGKLF